MSEEQKIDKSEKIWTEAEIQEAYELSAEDIKALKHAKLLKPDNGEDAYSNEKVLLLFEHPFYLIMLEDARDDWEQFLFEEGIADE